LKQKHIITNKQQQKEYNMTNTKTNTINHTYSTEAGVVLGKRYGGGLGYTDARNFTADSIKGLKDKVQKAFDLGSLAADCDLEKLFAAGVVLVDEATVEIDGKVFTNVSKENFVVGDVDLFNEKVEEGYIIDENAVEE